LVAPAKLIKEMLRVTKENSSFIIVTYGDPDVRLKFFESAVNEGDNEQSVITYQRIELSMMSNFINSLRNRSNNGPISSAIKDQTILLNAVLDVYDSKINDKTLDQAVRKKYLCMKLIAMTKLKKIENEKRLEKLAQIKLEESANSSIQLTEATTTQGTELQAQTDVEKNSQEEKPKMVSKEEMKNTIQNMINDAFLEDKSKEVIQSKEEKEEKIEAKKEEKNNKRRTHCFAYIFKKNQVN
jgi:hypothetical protein